LRLLRPKVQEQLIARAALVTGCRDYSEERETTAVVAVLAENGVITRTLQRKRPKGFQPINRGWRWR
jgi:hypothetical protein